MPYLRKLPSGKWQATVRHPDGRRLTRTDPLKRVVQTWARDTEAQLARGAWRDPRQAQQVTVGDWWARWAAGRIVEAETARGDESSWRNHLQPELGRLALRDLTRAGVQAWMRRRLDAGVGRQVLRRAFNLLRTMLRDAVHEGLIESNPCAGLSSPAPPPRQPVWFTPGEVEAIVEALPEGHAVMARLMIWSGLRWGEAAAVRGTDVDWLRRRVRVERVLAQSGREKEYPKTSTSRREVPVPADVLDAMSALLEGRGAGDLVFVTSGGAVRGGRPLSASNWRKVWDVALERAGIEHRSPHVCRHTCASWLVQAGVPLYDVRRQLGHSSMAVTERYAHLAPDVHDAVTGAWERIATNGRDARATHGT